MAMTHIIHSTFTYLERGDSVEARQVLYGRIITLTLVNHENRFIEAAVIFDGPPHIMEMADKSCPRFRRSGSN